MIPGTNIPARDRQRSSTPSGPSSVNTLLSKLRIEQQRHQVNLARKRYVGNDNSTERLPPLLGIGPTTQATTSPFQDIPDYTAPLPYSVSYTRSTRRATPGPKAPASWCPGAAPDTASTFDTRQGLSGFEDKWDCYALWLEYVLPKFLSGHLLPRPPRTRKFTQGSEVQVTESNGAQSLLQTSLAVLAGQLRPPDQGVDVELAYWITSDEVKHLMGCDWRIAIMVQGVLRYSPSWRSLRNLCLGSLHQDDPGHAITDEEADWEDGATTSDWGSEEDVAEHVPQLPILDLSFVTIPPPRSPSSRLFLSLFTSEASVRGLTALSLAASNLSFGEAMGYIPIAGANKTFGLKLRHLNLAGIRSTSVEELKRGLNKLRRVGDTLEVSIAAVSLGVKVLSLT